MPKLKKQTDLSQNGLANFFSKKKMPASLPQPKKVKCFRCSQDFYIKFVIPQQDYSKKNSWGY